MPFPGRTPLKLLVGARSAGWSAGGARKVMRIDITSREGIFGVEDGEAFYYLVLFLFTLLVLYYNCPLYYTVVYNVWSAGYHIMRLA